MCTATGKPVRRGGLPDRLEHRFAVRLAGLHRNADLNQLGMRGEPLDLGDRALGVFGVDPDGAAEPIRGVGFQPAVEQPVVDRGTDPAVEQIVGNVAAGQRVQHGVVDAAIVEQMPGHGVGIRARVVLAVEVFAVVAARCLIPLLFDVGDRPQSMRGG